VRLGRFRREVPRNEAVTSRLIHPAKSDVAATPKGVSQSARVGVEGGVIYQPCASFNLVDCIPVEALGFITFDVTSRVCAR
jgi:hypothetical protein